MKNNKVKLASGVWNQVFGNIVVDPDGWRSPSDPGWEEDEITLDEFRERASASTVKVNSEHRVLFNGEDFQYDSLPEVFEAFEIGELDDWKCGFKIVNPRCIVLLDESEDVLFACYTETAKEMISILLSHAGAPSWYGT